jgi:hypothetical protein
MRKADKRELMIQWFHQNFEDPAENTPYESAEGGYQWIWGGPSDARDELNSMFDGLASETLIEEVADHIERDGLTEWAPVQKVEDWEDIDWSEKLDEPPPVDIYLDEPSPRYGTPEEREARAKARAALDRLQKALERRIPIGIGHNQPPDDTKPGEVLTLNVVIEELKAEFGKQNPTISLIKKNAAVFRKALIACGQWGAKKLDKGVDAGIKVIGAGAGTYILTQCFPSMNNAFKAIIDWLEIAAKSIL